MWREKLPISASRTDNLFSASCTGNLLMKNIIFAIVFTIHFGLLAQNEYSCAEMHLKGKVKSIAETTQYAYPPQKLATMKMQSPIPTLYSFNQRGDLTEKSIGADIKYVYQYDRYQHYLSGGKKYVYSEKIKADIMFIRVKDGAFWEELTFYKKMTEKLRIDYLSPVHCKITHTIAGKVIDEKEIYYQKPYSYTYSKIDYILRDGKKEVYTYNDQDEVATITFYDEKGEVSNSYHYDYVYDGQGNWVEKKQTFQTLIPDKYPEIVRREITYYN